MPDSTQADSPQAPPVHTVVFDVGAVVLGWSPQLAYEQVLPRDQVPGFMDQIDFATWNRVNDGGRLFDDAELELIEALPDSAEAVRAYRLHFARTLTGMIPGTGAVIAELEQAGVRLLALTNWSAETFPHALQRFGLLRRFEGIVVSGAERLAKPDRTIFELLCRRYAVNPASCTFVDDSPPNVAAAASVGMRGIHFTDAAQLRADLVDLGLLGERLPVRGPIFHLTESDVWRAALASGSFPWSSRDLSYDRQGFVHCSFAEQVESVASRYYADVKHSDLVVLELDPARLDLPVIVEEAGPGEGFPHLYAELAASMVVSSCDLPTWLGAPKSGATAPR